MRFFLKITIRCIYLPVYGSDPENWKRGFSTSKLYYLIYHLNVLVTDKMTQHMIEANTRKIVVPISIPYSFCRRGFTLRSISWVVKGLPAEQIIQIPKKKFATII
jgi:hypothetical protein